MEDENNGMLLPNLLLPCSFELAAFTDANQIDSGCFMTRTGIDIVGDMPWGTHFCQFYQTKQDLIDILVPYFREGLHQNEFCLWITSEPLGVDDAKAALRQAAPDLDDYLKSGQIEILDYSEWYTPSGKFETNRVLQGWIDKEKNARRQGYEGLRLSGNIFWLEKKDWKSFSDYEAVINDVIGNYRMIAICTYSIDKCGAFEMIDVVSNHQFTLIKQSGEWKIIESQQQRKVETALHESEHRYKSLVELSPLAIAVHRGNKYIYVNPACVQLFGASGPEEIIGKNVLDFVHPDDRQTVTERIKHLQSTGETTLLRDSKIIRPDGQAIHISVSATVINYDGLPSIQVVMQDNTERKRAEQALAYLASFPERNPSPIIELDATGLIHYINPTARRLFPDLMERKFLHPWLAGLESVSDALWTGQSGTITREVTVDERWYQQTISYIEEGRLARIYGFDITELELAKKALQSANEKLEQNVEERTAALRTAFRYARNLLEASIDPLATISPEGQIMDVNKATEMATGVAREQLIGSDFSAYFTDPGKANEGYQAVLSQGFVKDYPLTIRHASGRTADVLYNATVYRNEAGEVQGVFAAARDVTEHNRMDKELHSLHEALERRADQLQNLASELTLTEHRERRRLAQLLHDHLQQLLYASRLSVTTLRRRVRDKDLQQMIQHLDMLLGQCIEESRSLTIELSPPVLYDAGLASALEWLSRQMQLNYGLMVEVEVEAEAEPETEDIKVLLFQSVRELLFNVVKHAGTQNALVKMSLAPYEQVRIDVVDKGAGFKSEHIQDNGDYVAGFGLFSIRERLEQMGGRLEVHTAAGEGTSVTIFAPNRWQQSTVKGVTTEQSTDETPAFASTEQSNTTPTRKIRVLLADDHTILRKGLVGVLNQESDIEVVAEAADGEMAVELTKQFNPDVVLMDVTMPKVDGIEATRRITKAQKDVCVIGFSAHKEEDMAQALYKAGAAAYLSKDEPAEFLIAAIRNILSKPAGNHNGHD